MQKDLTILAIQGNCTSQTAARGGRCLGGRPAAVHTAALSACCRPVIIDLNARMRATPGSNADVILRNGDELIVRDTNRKLRLSVKYRTPLHTCNASSGRDDYIA